jgi:predicted metal-dependent HD superfamily phosphohydrolase
VLAPYHPRSIYHRFHGMTTQNTLNKYDHDLFNALVNSWMVKNKVFNNDQGAVNFSNHDDTTIISSTWDTRWEFLDDYFHRIAKDPSSSGYPSSLEDGEDRMDDIHDVITIWKEKIRISMTEPGRYYHTHMHLEEMLGYMDIVISFRGASLQQIAQDCKNGCVNAIRATMTLAILFHDAIYDPKSGTNEEDSAFLFGTFASELSQAMLTAAERLPPVHSSKPFASSLFDFDRVKRYILATKYHNTSITDDPLLAIFLDMDMAVLGKVAAAYDVYAGSIRREFSHVDRSLYCRKRAQVLSEFLSNESIFSSQYMKDAFEVQARENLTREIDQLSRDIIPGEIT